MPRLMVGCAGLVWGAWQLSVAAGAVPADGVVPAIAVALLLTAGLVLIPVRAGEALEGARLAVEAVMFAAAASLLLWRLVIRPAVLAGVQIRDAVLLTLVETVLAGVAFIVAVREIDRGRLLACAGTWLLVAGQVAATIRGLTGPPGWWAATAGLPGWALLAAGLLLLRADLPAAAERHRPAAEARRLVVSTSVPFLLAAGAVALPRWEPTTQAVPPVTVGLSLTFLLSFWGRELVRAVQQRRLMHRLYLLAGSDPLTGLGNRRALADTMADLYRHADRPASVLVVDLDGFNDVNTLLGHHTGDDLLVAAARAMQEACEQHPARAFRLGGDEFAVLVDAGPAVADELATTLPVVLAGAATAVHGPGRVALTASIGLVHRDVGDRTGAGRTGSTAAAASPVQAGLADLSHAGDALRSAQAAGGARTVTYGTPVAERLNRRAALERRLRQAIARSGIELVYQPIISLPEMRMSGLETLARWSDEEFGAIPPDEFIPIAEDCGLIGELGLQIMRRSMVTSMQTGAQEAGLVCGVNVSTLQLRTPGFVREVTALLDETCLPPSQLVLELTESVLIGDDDPAAATLFGLAALGVVIAIDDFGTGYSSLSYLSRLPVRVLKLDRSITQRLSDPRGLAIARCVSDMSRTLKIDVVAEGIETLDDLARVRRLGAGFGQGWLFGRPVTRDRLAEFVRDPALVLAGTPALAGRQDQAGSIG